MSRLESVYCVNDIKKNITVVLILITFIPYIACLCYVLWYMDCGVEVSESNLSWKVHKNLAVI